MGLLVSHDHLMEALMSLVEVGGNDLVETIVTMVTCLSRYQHLRLVSCHMYDINVTH